MGRRVQGAAALAMVATGLAVATGSAWSQEGYAEQTCRRVVG